jgi:hypothetical protein
VNALRALPWLLAVACSQGGGGGQAASPGVADRDVIDPWLLCHDCTDGELDTLTVVGRLRPAVVESLSTDLLGGPAPGRRDNIELQIEQSFATDTAYENSLGIAPPVTAPDYVSQYAENYVAVYRAHAGVALAAIGGARAKTALDSAVAGGLRPGSAPLRPDVQEAVKSARDTLWAQ